jgi:integrase
VISVAYGAGLRASEVVSLKVSDIDSKRLLIRVEQGKGHAARQTKSPVALPRASLSTTNQQAVGSRLLLHFTVLPMVASNDL